MCLCDWSKSRSKSGGCAGMSYIMEYAKEIKPNEEVIEQKGVKF